MDVEQLTLRIADGSPETMRQVLDSLHRASVDVDQVSVHRPDLDDVFFAFTGKEGTPS